MLRCICNLSASEVAVVATCPGGLAPHLAAEQDRRRFISGILPLSLGCAGLLLASRSYPPSRAEVRQDEIAVARAWVEYASSPNTAETLLQAASPRCKRFIAWVLARGIEVVVFDMDLTMGGGHCGEGLPRDKLEDYIDMASPDFVEAAVVLCHIPGVHLAVATMSDPAEYDLPGQSRDTHILGPDLAEALIKHWCPEALPKFGIMVGFDGSLHEDIPAELGKSLHMRRIAKHYGVPFERMVLIDDNLDCLKTCDGWHGVHVRDRRFGFRFEDCFDDTRF